MKMSTPCLETLREQYKIAVELYRHEDDLNWRKLNHLFYSNAGLWAVVGFVLQSGASSVSSAVSPRCLVGVVSAVGSIMSMAFGIAIWYGIRYMHSRKDAVSSIERILVEHGGQYVVSSPGEKEAFLRVSPTMWMLRSAPILLFMVWIVMFIANLLRP